MFVILLFLMSSGFRLAITCMYHQSHSQRLLNRINNKSRRKRKCKTKWMIDLIRVFTYYTHLDSLLSFRHTPRDCPAFFACCKKGAQT